MLAPFQNARTGGAFEYLTAIILFFPVPRNSGRVPEGFRKSRRKKKERGRRSFVPRFPSAPDAEGDGLAVSDIARHETPSFVEVEDDAPCVFQGEETCHGDGLCRGAGGQKQNEKWEDGFLHDDFFRIGRSNRIGRTIPIVFILLSVPHA